MNEAVITAVVGMLIAIGGVAIIGLAVSTMNMMREIGAYFNIKRWDLLRKHHPDVVEEAHKARWSMKP